jgi:ankyrin repeat protein
MAAPGIERCPNSGLQQAENPDDQYTVVEFLIRAGADPNSLDKSGVAPLHRAVHVQSVLAAQPLFVHC